MGVHRNQENQFVYKWFGFGSFAMGAITFLAVPGLGGAIFAATASVAGVAALRFAGAAAFTAADGVTIRQAFRSTRVPWSEVKRFTLRRRGLFPLIGILEREDGTNVPIYGIQAPNPMTRPGNMEAQREVLGLNAELARAKGIRLEDIRQADHLPVIAELLAHSSFSSERVTFEPTTGEASVPLKQLDIRAEHSVKRFWPAQKVETPVVERTLKVHGVTEWSSRSRADDDELADIQFDGGKVLLVGTEQGLLTFRVTSLHLTLEGAVAAGTESHWDVI